MAFSFAETVALVRNYIMDHLDVYHNKSRFIEGWGWDHTSWLVEDWPTAVRVVRYSCCPNPLTCATPPPCVKDALDEDPVIHGKPVVLQSKDGHALWVSKTVLQWCGPLLEDVKGGVVVRDTFGNPTGSLDSPTICLVSCFARRIP